MNPFDSTQHGEMADTPAVDKVVFNDGDNGPATVVIVSRFNHPARPATVLWSTDGTWPELHAPGTTSTPIAKGASSPLHPSSSSPLHLSFTKVVNWLLKFLAQQH
jgi:hypothetical protein